MSAQVPENESNVQARCKIPRTESTARYSTIASSCSSTQPSTHTHNSIAQRDHEGDATARATRTTRYSTRGVARQSKQTSTTYSSLQVVRGADPPVTPISAGVATATEANNASPGTASCNNSPLSVGKTNAAFSSTSSHETTAVSIARHDRRSEFITQNTSSGNGQNAAPSAPPHTASKAGQKAFASLPNTAGSTGRNTKSSADGGRTRNSDHIDKSRETSIRNDPENDGPAAAQKRDTISLESLMTNGSNLNRLVKYIRKLEENYENIDILLAVSDGKDLEQHGNLRSIFNKLDSFWTAISHARSFQTSLQPEFTDLKQDFDDVANELRQFPRKLSRKGLGFKGTESAECDWLKPLCAIEAGSTSKVQQVMQLSEGLFHTLRRGQLLRCVDGDSRRLTRVCASLPDVLKFQYSVLYVSPIEESFVAKYMEAMLVTHSTLDILEIIEEDCEIGLKPDSLETCRSLIVKNAQHATGQQMGTLVEAWKNKHPQLKLVLLVGAGGQQDCLCFNGITSFAILLKPSELPIAEDEVNERLRTTMYSGFEHFVNEWTPAPPRSTQPHLIAHVERLQYYVLLFRAIVKHCREEFGWHHKCFLRFDHTLMACHGSFSKTILHLKGMKSSARNLLNNLSPSARERTNPHTECSSSGCESIDEGGANNVGDEEDNSESNRTCECRHHYDAVKYTLRELESNIIEIETLGRSM